MTLPTPLINRTRAQQVLANANVDAMVLGEPMNIYHATGFWPQTLVMGHAGSSLAVVPADSSRPVVLITAQFLHYFFDLDAADPQGPLDILLYTAPDEDGENAIAPMFFQAASGGTTDIWERATRQTTLDHLQRRPAYPSSRRALADVLGSLGDSLAVDGFVAQSFIDAPARPAEPLLRRTRMIKSAYEVGLMRFAAQQNCEAARAAVASVGAGDRIVDLQNAYFAETGRRGGRPVFMSADYMPYRTRNGIITRGRAFSIDAVSSYSGYHGDYGRTIIVGEPTTIVERAIEAAIVCNEAVRAALGPGMRYSDVTRIGRDAMVAAGHDVVSPASPHSVGLLHTDEAFAGDSLTFAKEDHVIEPNMVLSVDCPILQTDMGGSVHLEDLWLITENGCEPLNDTADPVLRID